jgi:hypothetical protein
MSMGPSLARGGLVTRKPFPARETASAIVAEGRATWGLGRT